MYYLNVHLHEDERFNEYELQPENREQRKGYVVFNSAGICHMLRYDNWNCITSEEIKVMHKLAQNCWIWILKHLKTIFVSQGFTLCDQL